MLSVPSFILPLNYRKESDIYHFSPCQLDVPVPALPGELKENKMTINFMSAPWTKHFITGFPCVKLFNSQLP